jgi:O-antigen/teichoic acid export membrane protein
MKDNDVNPESCENSHRLTAGHKITRNSILNIMGYCAPVAVAVVTIPVLIRIMGTERFGVLALAWAIIGYFSLFDFGLNRALTKMVAEKLGSGDEKAIPDLILTALIFMIGIGLAVCAILVICLPWLVRDILNIPDDLIEETRIGFLLLAISVPLVIVSVALRGVLSAYQRFDLVNLVRVPMGIFIFLAPIPVIKWYQNALHPVLVVLILGRLIAMLVQLRLCNTIVPFLRSGAKFQRKLIRPLLSFGGWVTISNVISPLMIYIDRFFIGALISASAVAFYATPNEAVTKLWYLPWALLGVLFPAFSTTLVRDAQLTFDIFENGVKYLFVAMFPIALLAMVFAFEGLSLWLGPDFAKNSASILKWMTVGVFLHSLAQIPYALLQGSGRPDMIAKAHLVELPLYCVLLWQLIRLAGTEGAAAAWTIRLGIDCVFSFYFVQKIMPHIVVSVIQKVGLLAAAIAIFILASLLEDLVVKSGFFIAVILIFAWLVWYVIFNPQDRGRIKRRFLNAP